MLFLIEVGLKDVTFLRLILFDVNLRVSDF